MKSTARLEELAARRHHVVSAVESRAAGVPQSTYQRFVTRRSIERLAPGIHVIQRAPSRQGRNEQLLVAALLANGVGRAPVALAARSALWAHGVLPRPEPLQIVIGANARATAVRGVSVVRTNRRIPLRIMVVAGWPTTSVGRAMLDLARVLDDQALLGVGCDALRAGALELDAIGAVLEANPGLHGGARLARLRSRLDGIRPDAASEVLVREGLARRGIPTEPRPRWLDTPLGRFQVDVPLLGVDVGIECDSVTYHGDDQSLSRDHRKTNAMEAINYRLLRVTHRQAVDNLEETLSLLDVILAR